MELVHLFKSEYFPTEIRRSIFYSNLFVTLTSLHYLGSSDNE